MNKVAFIIPGFFGSTSEYGYQKIGKIFGTNGFKVVYVDVTWRYKRIVDYLNQLRTIYNSEKGETNIILGFSYGATIAYLSTPFLKPNSLYLCSPAPYFVEDLKYIPQLDKKEIGKKRLQDIENCSFNQSAKKISCPVTIFFGENEQEFLKRRVVLAKEKLKKIDIIEIPNAGHNISDDNYIKYVQKRLETIFSQC